MAIIESILAVAEIFKDEIKQGVKSKLAGNYKLWTYPKEWGLIKLTPDSDFLEIYNHTLYEFSNNGKSEEIIRLFDLKPVREAFRKQWYSNKTELIARQLDTSWHTDPKVVDLKKMDFDFPKEISDFLDEFRREVNFNRPVYLVETEKKIDEILSEAKKISHTINDGKLEIPVELTLIPRPEGMIGREDKIKHIKKLFESKKELILVNGVGGIGKTIVGLLYIDAFKGLYDHCAWIQVTDTIRNAFISNTYLIITLGLEEKLKEIKPKEIENTGFLLIIQRINSLGSKTLLVIDNANNYDDLVKMVPVFRGMNCKVLLTSRTELDGMEIITLDELPPEQALQLFFKRYLPGIDHFSAKEKSVATGILEKLEYHTLLTELIAKSARKAGIPLDVLADKVKKQYIHNEELNLFRLDTGLHGENQLREERLTNYITLLFREITALDAKEHRYLRYFSLLPSQEFPLVKLFVIFNISKREKQSFCDSLDSLVNKGWLTRKTTETHPTWKLHSLLSDVVISELKPDQVNCNPVIFAMAGVLKTGKMGDRLSWLQFGEHIIEKLRDIASENINDLRNNIVMVYRDLGKREEARKLLENALRKDIKNFGKDHLTVAETQSNLGLVYRDLGKYKKACMLLEHALSSDIKNIGEDHSTVTLRQYNLALVYKDLGESKKAHALLENALRSDKKNMSACILNIAIRQTIFAAIYMDWGEYEKALELLKKGLISGIKNFGENNPTVALRKWAIGTIYGKLHDNKKASEFISQAYKTYLKTLGKEHPVTKKCKFWFDLYNIKY